MTTLAALDRDGARLEIDPKHVDGLRAALRGSLLVAGDPGYDESRSIWNAMIDRRPALVARCVGVSDIITCVNFARQHGIATVIVDKNHAAIGRIANRVVILVKGRVVFEGESAALLAEPDVLHRHLGV